MSELPALHVTPEQFRSLKMWALDLDRTAYMEAMTLTSFDAIDGMLAELHQALGLKDGAKLDVVIGYPELDKLKHTLVLLRSLRGRPQHRPGTPEHYRQEGELTALNVVLDIINGEVNGDELIELLLKKMS
jgi:hypothetical protein